MSQPGVSAREWDGEVGCQVVQFLQLPDPCRNTIFLWMVWNIFFALEKHPKKHKINGQNTLLNRKISSISSISMGHFHLFSMAPWNHQRVFKVFHLSRDLICDSHGRFCCFLVGHYVGIEITNQLCRRCFFCTHIYGYGSIPMKIPFLVGWTSINPSYDLGFTRYQGFDPSPYYDIWCF